MKQRLDAFIESKRDDMISDLQELIAIESVTGRKKENDEALDYFLERAREFGMRTGTTKNHDAGYAEIGEGKETVGVLVHLDVVDVGDIGKWRFSPFSGEVEDGYLWGRGAIDDKGAAVMSLYALKAILDADCPMDRRVRLIVGTSEESDWTDMENYIAEFGMPDFGFTPDGDFPIYNAEKGYADVLLTFSEPELTILENVEAGDAPNTIPSKAYIKWKDGREEEFHGKAAHSSEPLEGENAILRLCDALGNEFDFSRFINDFCENEDLCPRFAIDDGGEYVGREWVGRSTAVPTLLRMNGKSVTMNINIRQKFGVEREDILSAFAGYAAEYGFTAQIQSGYLSGIMVSSTSEHLRLMKQVYEEYGYKGEFMAAAGTSYAKAMPNFVSWGPVFRTDPNCFHVENERLSLNTLVVAAKMYAWYLFRVSVVESKNLDRERSTSIQKALSLLELFLEPPYVLLLSQVVEKSKMNRTTVYRDLTAFEDAGILIRDERNKTYSMGPKAFRMGNVYLRSSKYQEHLLELLEKIAEEVRESVGLARREGNSVISIYSIESHQPVKMNDLPGEFYPMNKGTYGKCLMAYHDEKTVRELLKKARFEKSAPNTLTRADDILAEYARIRRDGFALSIEETAPLIIGVGVPLRDSSGGVRNVVAVSFLKHGDYEARIESIKATLFNYKPLLEACL